MIKPILNLMGPTGEVLAKINSEEEIEILCAEEDFKKALTIPTSDRYYRSICILFKCILSLHEKNK